MERTKTTRFHNSHIQERTILWLNSLDMATSNTNCDAEVQALNNAMATLQLQGTTACVDDSAELGDPKAEPQVLQLSKFAPAIPTNPRTSTFASQLAKLHQTPSPSPSSQQPPTTTTLVTIHFTCGHTILIDDSHATAETYYPAPYHEPFPCHSPECRNVFLHQRRLGVCFQREFPKLPGVSEVALDAEARKWGRWAEKWAMGRKEKGE